MKRVLISLFVFGIFINPLLAAAAEPIAEYQLQEGDELHLCIHHPADFSYVVVSGPGPRLYPSAIEQGIDPLTPGSELGLLPDGDHPGVGMIFINRVAGVEAQNTRFFAILAAPFLRKIFNFDPAQEPAPYVVLKHAGDQDPPCVEGQEMAATLRIIPLENITPLQVTQVVPAPELVEVEPADLGPQIDPVREPIIPNRAEPGNAGGCSLGNATTAGDFSTLVSLFLMVGLVSRFLIYFAFRKN